MHSNCLECLYKHSSCRTNLEKYWEFQRISSNFNSEKMKSVLRDRICWLYDTAAVNPEGSSNNWMSTCSSLPRHQLPVSSVESDPSVKPATLWQRKLPPPSWSRSFGHLGFGKSKEARVKAHEIFLHHKATVVGIIFSLDQFTPLAEAGSGHTILDSHKYRAVLGMDLHLIAWRVLNNLLAANVARSFTWVS